MLSRNVELLKQEETLLQEWLEIIQQQQRRAMLNLDVKRQSREIFEQQSVHPEITGFNLGSTQEGRVADQTSADNSSEDESNLLVQTEPPKETHVQRNQLSSPAQLLPPVQDDDISTVVSPAEESFNPLASFFRST